jgi:hypothetical protein
LDRNGDTEREDVSEALLGGSVGGQGLTIGASAGDGVLTALSDGGVLSFVNPDSDGVADRERRSCRQRVGDGSEKFGPAENRSQRDGVPIPERPASMKANWCSADTRLLRRSRA